MMDFYYFQSISIAMGALSVFRDGGSYLIETSPLIYRANQKAGFYLIGTDLRKS